MSPHSVSNDRGSAYLSEVGHDLVNQDGAWTRSLFSRVERVFSIVMPAVVVSSLFKRSRLICSGNGTLMAQREGELRPWWIIGSEPC